MPVPIRCLAVALALCCGVFAGAAACGSGSIAQEASAYIAVHTPTPTSPAERIKVARARFAADAGLASGATQQWIVQPSKAGTFNKGAKGRRNALVKAELAGSFAYNRLRAAVRDARGDPRLARGLAPLAPGIDGLKNLPSRLRKGDASAAGSYADLVEKVQAAGRRAGTPVRNELPSAVQLARG